MLDILIKNTTLITMAGEGVGVIEDGAIGIKGNRIAVVGKSKDVVESHKAKKVIDGKNKAVMPGFVDAHIHTGIALLRGLSQDITNWMPKGLWPFVKVLTNDGSIKGSLVNIIESVKAGTTTFCDYDSLMEEIVKNHAIVGTRARVTETINELPPNISDLKVGDLYPLDRKIGEEKLEASLRLVENWHGKENGRITCLFGPQGPDMVSKDLLLKIKDYAEKYDTLIHMHVSQGDREIDQMIKRFNTRSIAYLDSIGYLDERLLAVHLTEATKEETQLLASRGSSMILCSGSLSIIDGIVPPLAEFLEVSDKGALGSDQAPGNNCNNMFNEMKFTAILNKCKVRDPRVFPAWKVLRLATIDGAKAIGLGDEIGSLEEGKKADMITIDLNKPSMTPVFHKPIRNIIPNLVYSARGDEVSDVIIDGIFIVEAGELKTVDEEKAVYEANQAALEVAERAKEVVLNMDTPLTEMMKKGQL